MLTRDFDFDLPAGSIAQEPAPRGESRLLVLDRQGAERHRQVRDLPALLRSGDLLVVNDTRVLPARLFGRRAKQPGQDDQETGGGRIELLLVEKTGPREWDVLAKPGRRTRPGTVIELTDSTGADAKVGLTAEVLAKAGDGRHRVRFSEEVEPHLERIGHVPLPPYIKRPHGASGADKTNEAGEAGDRAAYQTVYAREAGAIAAPTAGLHFSEALLAELRAQGVEIAAVTLHVGIGTFKPVTAELVHEHRMERERYTVPEETAAALAAVRSRGGRVVAVGTTVVRTLESAALQVPAGPLATQCDVLAGAGATDLFIVPGFRFQVVDVLLTNFHLPRSTLLMLVSAFAGQERVLAAYREAVAAGYRFYSYGDAMLAERAPG
ncbi:MAG TPA: tRNA preQ1(34) S-adenosylmethionine ribosyltransferase-isomerase QueA [Thermoanaerobaculia bacterium]|nr:tRNA preQ1(34) S-adenosylmethionine ribosyltransferase-isomerase QueA [Thermoanaerobaculia bacterium]